MYFAGETTFQEIDFGRIFSRKENALHQNFLYVLLLKIIKYFCCFLSLLHLSGKTFRKLAGFNK